MTRKCGNRTNFCVEKRQAKKLKSDTSPSESSLSPWRDFDHTDETVTNRLRESYDVEFKVPTDLHALFGVRRSEAINARVLKSFWYEVDARSKCIKAILKKWNDPPCADKTFLSILGVYQDDFEVASQFLKHVREGHPAYDAILSGYNKSKWKRLAE
ncbi:hypothetical protein CYMTET_55199 [Cymbomonas tetramitiformis]|uniref:Uncharacterized protein n=1 Tax=Cymbomonas tetramitiformis TaxID=36881 RepID=A0AAE0BFD7_9CHLO|nr:hypothetical protein CYMTET_55199 [Cymbomonas tetramitiformis]